MGAVINMLPQSGGGIKGSTVFKWFDSGILDTSVCGGFVGQTETNGRNNISTVAADGYLRVWSTQSGYGQSRVFSANSLPKGEYDYALVHVVSLSTLNTSFRLTLGTTTAKSATQTADVDSVSAPNSLSDKWIAVPFVRRNASSSNHYFTLGLVGDCKIDKIWFVKLK